MESLEILANALEPLMDYRVDFTMPNKKKNSLDHFLSQVRYNGNISDFLIQLTDAFKKYLEWEEVHGGDIVPQFSMIFLAHYAIIELLKGGVSRSEIVGYLSGFFKEWYEMAMKNGTVVIFSKNLIKMIVDKISLREEDPYKQSAWILLKYDILWKLVDNKGYF